jgi:hypothetical protein
MRAFVAFIAIAALAGGAIAQPAPARMPPPMNLAGAPATASDVPEPIKLGLEGRGNYRKPKVKRAVMAKTPKAKSTETLASASPSPTMGMLGERGPQPTQQPTVATQPTQPAAATSQSATPFTAPVASVERRSDMGGLRSDVAKPVAAPVAAPAVVVPTALVAPLPPVQATAPAPTGGIKIVGGKVIQQ